VAWLRRNSPVALLGVALVASSALLLWLGADLTYFQDSWAFLVERRGFSAGDFLRPHNEHISVVPVAIQKLLLALGFGMESDFGERVVLTAMLAAIAVLLFVYVRRRIGPWPALIAAVILLFLGPAWEVLLWPFEISLAGSVLCGLGALLLLERDDGRGDVAACVLLAIAIGFSSLGIPFVVAAAVDVLQQRRERGWARAYVPGIPTLLFLGWYVAYGHDAESAASLHSVLHAPIFVAEGLGASVASILGLRTLAGGIESQQRPYLGLIAVGAILALVIYAVARRPDWASRLLRQPAPGLWPVLAATLTFWGLAGINDLPGRAPWASRYMHVGAIFVFLVLANLLAGISLGKRVLLAAGGVAAVAIALNLVPLIEGRDRLEKETVLARADLAAIEIASRTVDSQLVLDTELAGTPSLIDVEAGPYLAAVEDHGSPAYTAAELIAAPEAGRRQADVVLARALPVSAQTRPGLRHRPGKRCVVGSGTLETPILAGATTIQAAPGPPVPLGLRRFATTEYPVPLKTVPGGSTTRLSIPRDASSRPWRLEVKAAQRVRVCR
jgi:hypothetical protein